MKVKVRVTDLIERVEAVKRRAQTDYEERLSQYPPLAEAYRAKVIDALDRELRRAKTGKPLPRTYGYWSGDRHLHGVVVTVGMREPVKPTKADVSRHNMRLRELAITTQDEIVIDPWSADWRGVI